MFIGLDVGKSEHHATALTSNADKVYDKTLPNSEPKLQHLLTKLVTKYGPALLVVDQPATIGALPVAVAQSLDDVEVAYLPGLTMRRVADLHAGSAKTDARDAYIIAETARTMPATLRAIAASDEQIAELAVLAGFDDDLLAQTTATRNRLRGLLTQIHPGLERVIGPKLERCRGTQCADPVANPTGVEDGWAGPCAQPDCQTQPATGDQADRGHLRGDGRPDGGGPGTNAAATVVPMLATQLAELYAQRADIYTQVQALVDDHPLSPVLTSMPGVAVRTAARLPDRSSGQRVQNRRPPGFLCWHCPDHQAIWHINPRGIRQPRRQQTAEISPRMSRAFASLDHEPSRRYYQQRHRGEKPINKPSSPSLDGASILCMPCCATAPFTMIQQPRLYQNISPKLGLALKSGHLE